VSDLGAGSGGAAFETLELRDGHPFALTRHLARLGASLAALGVHSPPPEQLRAAAESTATAWGTAPGRLRLTVLLDRRGGAPRILAVAGPHTAVQRDPVEVVTVPWPRNERSPLSSAKTGASADLVAAGALARRRGAAEAILTDTRGHLCEATTANLVVGLGGCLVTPPLGPGVLPGVTRQLLVEAMAGTAHPLEERPIAATELGEAEELFLLSTGRLVQPVSAVDGHLLPRCPGPLTAAAAARWHEAYDGVIDP